jgi:hypothetical protein
LDNSAQYAGKRLLIVEDSYFLDDGTFAALKRMKIAVIRTTAEGFGVMINAETFDGAIIDLAIDADNSLKIAETLEERDIPHVFATHEPPGLLNPRFKPYRLCADAEELMVIFGSLFDQIAVN